MGEWPKKIIQTYHAIDKIPKVVHTNLEKYASDYEHIIFSDEMCINFLREHYGNIFVDKFNYFEQGAFKADLFRYCYLYKHGGLYLDIKTILIKSLDEVFTDRTKCYSVKSSVPQTIYQGVIASPPHNVIFSEVIDYVMKVLTNEVISNNYEANTRRFWNAINPHQKDWVLFQEVCGEDLCEKTGGKDQYGACCVVQDDGGNDVFYTRFRDYPW